MCRMPLLAICKDFIGPNRQLLQWLVFPSLNLLAALLEIKDPALLQS
jgi:hypothetical protein